MESCESGHQELKELQMKCPKCKARTKIIDSRPTKTSVRRRHVCKACNHRFTTIELRFDEVKKQLRQFKQIGKDLQKLKLLSSRLTAMSEAERQNEENTDGRYG